MSRQTEKKLSDFCQWYHSQKPPDSASPENRIRFLEKAITLQYWLLSYVVEDMQKLEHRDERENAPRLHLPLGVRLDEPLREGNA